MTNKNTLARQAGVFNEPVSRRELIIRGGLSLAALGLYGIAGCGSDHPNHSSRPHETRGPVDKYPKHTVVASVFWIGEGASSANANISNTATEWDPYAIKHFGGIDNPKHRRPDGSGLPAGFRPLQNPYYVALPASEFGDNGLVRGARQHAPWYHGETSENISVFKGHWLKITNPATHDTVFAQWLDTGPSDDPNAVYDYDYVFGPSSARPKNTFGLGAGIDLSPTAAHGLGVAGSLADGSATVSWQFVDQTAVPQGPWTQFAPIDDKVYW